MGYICMFFVRVFWIKKNFYHLSLFSFSDINKYELIVHKVTWDNALCECKQKNKRLATLRTKDDFYNAKAFLKEKQYWDDLKLIFHWTINNYFHFSTHEPNAQVGFYQSYFARRRRSSAALTFHISFYDQTGYVWPLGHWFQICTNRAGEGVGGGGCDH